MFDLLSPLLWCCFFITIFIAFLVRGITGFGSGLIAIPILSLFLPVALVVPVVGLMDFSGAAGHSFKYKSHIHWRDLLPLLPFTLLGILCALYLFKTLEGETLKKALAIFLFLYALYSLFINQPKQKHSQAWALPAGGLGGFIGTLFGTGGPFYVLYLHLRQHDKGTFRATIATIFLIDGIGRIVGYAATGVYTEQVAFLFLLGIPTIYVAMKVGGKIHTNLTQRQFQIGISYLLIACSIALFI